MGLEDHSESVPSDSLGELEILGHNCNSLGMDGAKVGVLEQGDQVSLGSLLKGEHGLALESNLLFPLLSNLSNHSLEGEFSDQQVSLR